MATSEIKIWPYSGFNQDDKIKPAAAVSAQIYQLGLMCNAGLPVNQGVSDEAVF